MIPNLVAVPGAPHLVLPPGIHWATLVEVAERFAFNDRRSWLFEGITTVAKELTAAGCSAMYLDGSFVTSKPEPEDFDGCWAPQGVRSELLHPLLLDFGPGRRRQKRVFRGEMFISGGLVSGGGTFLDFFQVEKHTGEVKGIIGLALSTIEPDQR